MNARRLAWIAALAVLVLAFIAYPRLKPFFGVAATASAAQPAGPGTAAPDGAHPAARKPGAGGRFGGGGPVSVITAVAESKSVPITRSYVASVEPVASVALHTRVDGMVLKVNVTEGETVKAGATLFQLDDRTIQAALAKDQANIGKDQAALNQAETDLKAVQALVARGVDSTQQGEQQQEAVDVASANLAGDKAQLSADQVQESFMTITAPMDGRVGQVSVSPGAFVRAADSTALLTITQMAPVRVSFTVPQRDLAAFRQALGASPPNAVSVVDAESGKTLADGRLVFIDSTVDAASGTVVIKAEVPNTDGALWPGQYVRAKAELDMLKDATVVPTAAVQLTPDGAFVFLVKPDSTVTKQTVTVADTAGDSAVIATGLKPGDHVVVEGQLRLNEGSAVREANAGGGAPGKAPVATD